jgi:hypothetical protein
MAMLNLKCYITFEKSCIIHTLLVSSQAYYYADCFVVPPRNDVIHGVIANEVKQSLTVSLNLT